MKRAEVLGRLTDIIPSFKRKWSGVGGTHDDRIFGGFTYSDPFFSYELSDGRYIAENLPFTIPENYLVGRKVRSNRGGDTLISVSPQKRDDRVVVGMSVTSFAGYSFAEHTYGSLIVPSPNWSIEGNPTCIVGGSLKKYQDDPNFSSCIGPNWEIELCRIITEEDINGRANWDDWNAGDANPRFVSRSEMYLTACWVALARLGMPFLLQGQECYYVSSDKTLLSVDASDDVTLYDFFFDNIPFDKHKTFGRL